jgi:hypothetical protein
MNMPMIAEPTRSVNNRNVTVTLLLRIRRMSKIGRTEIRYLQGAWYDPGRPQVCSPKISPGISFGKISGGGDKNPGAFSPESFLPVPLRRLPGLPWRLAVLAAGCLRGRPGLVSILRRTPSGTGAGSPAISGRGTSSRRNVRKRVGDGIILRMAATEVQFRKRLSSTLRLEQRHYNLWR